MKTYIINFQGWKRLCRFLGVAFAVAGLTMALSACETVAGVGARVGEATGTITPEQGESIRRTGAALERTFEDLTPEQEHFIGRTVAATILDSYSVYENAAATEYLNLLGQVLAMVSDRPETFGGYRFLILDSDEINAFAAPGGFIFVSRGMLRLCQTEDELAAVLAHEIGHVQHQHGLRAIRSSRWAAALAVGLTEAGRSWGGEELRQLTAAFEGAIDDITSTLMVNGYSRRLEREADEAAVTIMRRLGYDPRALIRMLTHMERDLRPGGLDFARTHPAPQDRIREIRRMRGIQQELPPPPPERQRRFDAAMRGI